MSACHTCGGLRLRFVFGLLIFLINAISSSTARAADGDLLVLDSDSGGNGALFKINRITGAAVPISYGIGCEPWSMVLQSPSRLIAVDATCETLYNINPNGGPWTRFGPVGGLLKYPSAAIVSNTESSVLVAVGFGDIISVDTNTGAQSLYASYGQLGAQNPWEMTRLRDGSLAVTDFGNGKVIRIRPDLSSSIISQGGLLKYSKGIVQLPDGDLAVANQSAFKVEEILRINPETGAQSYLTPPGSFKGLAGLGLDGDGNLLVPDHNPGLSEPKLYKVWLNDGHITTMSSDTLLNNPVAVLVLPEPGTCTGLISLVVFLRRRRHCHSGKFGCRL